MSGGDNITKTNFPYFLLSSTPHLIRRRTEVAQCGEPATAVHIMIGLPGPGGVSVLVYRPRRTGRGAGGGRRRAAFLLVGMGGFGGILAVVSGHERDASPSVCG